MVALFGKKYLDINMRIFKSKQKKLIFAEELFYFLSALLFIFVIMELVFPRIILVYFNINILLILVVVSGINLLIKEA